MYVPALLGVFAAAVAVLFRVRHRLRWPARRDSFTAAFRRREFRKLDEHLEAVAREELCRLEEKLSRYLAGRAGHVVAVTEVPKGLALQLSDGRYLALRGISPHMTNELTRHASVSAIRPESVQKDIFSYQLRFRQAAGAEIRIYARNVVLVD